MTSPAKSEVTQLLLAWSNGDQSALGKLVPLVHQELHRLAKRYLRNERPGHILQTTDLVDEAYLRLMDASQVAWQNRAHFFAISAKIMRNILVDFARKRPRISGQREAQHVSLDEASVISKERSAIFEALDDALKALAAIDPLKSQIVELRFFGGLSIDETAEVLKISPRTVDREWKAAKAWLSHELNGGRKDEP